MLARTHARAIAPSGRARITARLILPDKPPWRVQLVILRKLRLLWLENWRWTPPTKPGAIFRIPIIVRVAWTRLPLTLLLILSKGL